MTKVINLFAGSGSGKSTTAALLFGNMKLRGLTAELVREYVKTWAWSGKKVEAMDQLYLLGKQTNYEKTLYGKVDYIVTDSPVLLCGIYEEYWSHGQKTYAARAALSYLDHAKEKGIEHINYFINRKKPFDPRGRYETAEQAREVDKYMKNYLINKNIPFVEIDCDDRDRVNFIIEDLKL